MNIFHLPFALNPLSQDFRNMPIPNFLFYSKSIPMVFMGRIPFTKSGTTYRYSKPFIPVLVITIGKGFCERLGSTQGVISAYFQNSRFQRPEKSRITQFPSLEAYLRKIAAVINNIDVLSRAAAFPQHKHRFAFLTVIFWHVLKGYC